jgi:hypothetical protein
MSSSRFGAFLLDKTAGLVLFLHGKAKKWDGDQMRKPIMTVSVVASTVLLAASQLLS